MPKLDIGHRKGLGMLTASLVALTATAMPAHAGEDCEETPQGFWERDTLLGSFDGKRTELCKHGIQFGATYTGEILGNPTGGLNRGAKGQGRTELDLDFDLEKLLEFKGTTVHASAMWIHGGRMSGKNIGNLMSVSNIEAIPAFRLFTLWGQQNLWDDAVSVRLGQIAVDDEFVVSKLSSVFVNSTFGFPFMISGNLPSGGPAFPLPSPGARLKLAVTDEISVMGAAFSGDPAGKFDVRDPQWRNHDGTTFSFSRGTFYITEGAWAVNQAKDAEGLPASYKLGVWYHSARFNDQHFDNLGQSLADTNTTGVGRPVRGDGGIYLVIDQMLTKEGLGVFLRTGASPSDRNQVSFYVDGGVSHKGLIPGRDDDTLALGVAYARLSDGLAGLDQDTRRINGQPNRPVRDSETVIELTYQAQLTPWWTLQPDVQYVISPGGNIPNPATGTRLTPIGDAAIFGVRTAVKF